MTDSSLHVRNAIGARCDIGIPVGVISIRQLLILQIAMVTTKPHLLILFLRKENPFIFILRVCVC